MLEVHVGGRARARARARVFFQDPLWAGGETKENQYHILDDATLVYDDILTFFHRSSAHFEKNNTRSGPLQERLTRKCTMSRLHTKITLKNTKIAFENAKIAFKKRQNHTKTHLYPGRSAFTS